MVIRIWRSCQTRNVVMARDSRGITWLQEQNANRRGTVLRFAPSLGQLLMLLNCAVRKSCMSLLEDASFQIKNALELLIQNALRVEKKASHLLKSQSLYRPAPIPNMLAVVIIRQVTNVA